MEGRLDGRLAEGGCRSARRRGTLVLGSEKVIGSQEVLLQGTLLTVQAHCLAEEAFRWALVRRTVHLARVRVELRTSTHTECQPPC